MDMLKANIFASVVMCFSQRFSDKTEDSAVALSKTKKTLIV